MMIDVSTSFNEANPVSRHMVTLLPVPPCPASCGEPRCRKTCKCRESGHSVTPITPWRPVHFDVWCDWHNWPQGLQGEVSQVLLGFWWLSDFLKVKRMEPKLFGLLERIGWMGWVVVLAMGGQNAIAGKCGTTASTLLDCCLPFH